MRPIKQVLSTRKYKAGYEIRTEVVDGEDFDGEDFKAKNAYTPSGDYIGPSKKAHRLCKTRGIKPELVDNSWSVCSIGFCEKDKKWYGWSYRHIYGFGIGSICEKGDSHYVPATFKELASDCHCRVDQDMCQANAGSEWDSPPTIQDAIAFHGEKYCEGKKLEDMGLIPVPGTQVLPVKCCSENCIFELGRGEWVAKTIEDAKQMAIDFTSGIS